MEEIFKKSTICFTDDREYKQFKENCLQRSKDFFGWEIIKEYNLIGFDDKIKQQEGFKFKVTFDMLKVV